MDTIEGNLVVGGGCGLRRIDISWSTSLLGVEPVVERVAVGGDTGGRGLRRSSSSIWFISIIRTRASIGIEMAEPGSSVAPPIVAGISSARLVMTRLALGLSAEPAEEGLGSILGKRWISMLATVGSWVLVDTEVMGLGVVEDSLLVWLVVVCVSPESPSSSSDSSSSLGSPAAFIEGRSVGSAESVSSSSVESASVVDSTPLIVLLGAPVDPRFSSSVLVIGVGVLLVAASVLEGLELDGVVVVELVIVGLVVLPTVVSLISGRTFGVVDSTEVLCIVLVVLEGNRTELVLGICWRMPGAGRPFISSTRPPLGVVLELTGSIEMGVSLRSISVTVMMGELVVVELVEVELGLELELVAVEGFRVVGSVDLGVVEVP